LAHYLSEQGVKAGDHVGLYMYNCNEYLEGMFACFKIRAVPINVNYRYVDEELLYIFDNANMAACIHGREFVLQIKKVIDSAPDLKTLIYIEDGGGEDPSSINSVEYEKALADSSAQRDFAERSDDDLFILYTGGTTGMPKGVMWPHKALFHATFGAGAAFNPEAGPIQTPEEIAERVSPMVIKGFSLAPLMHGTSWWFCCIMFLAGCTVVLNQHRHFRAEEAWDLVEKEKINSLTIVGDAMALPLIDTLKKNPDRWDLSSVLSIGSGGAVFSDSKQDAFRELFPYIRISNNIGSSEAGNMITRLNTLLR